MIDEKFLEVEGLQTVEDIIAIMSQITNAYRGIEYAGGSRLGENCTNAQVLNWLDQSSPGGGRDFRVLSDADSEQLAQAFAREVDSRIQKYANRVAKYEAKGGPKAPTEPTARAISAAAWKAAATKYAEIMQSMVGESRVAGGAADPVSPEYAKQRAREWGQPDDVNIVGRRSRQLHDSLNPALTVGKFKLLK